jgi:integrase
MDMVSKALRMATKWSDAQGRPLLMAKPTMPSIRVANTRERILEADEEALVLHAIAARKDREPGRQWFRLEALIRFLLDTGARLGEALNTGPHHLSYMDGQVYVTFPRYRTKSDKPRTVPLTAVAVAALSAIAPQAARPRGGTEDTYFPLTAGTAWYMWDNVRNDVAKLGADISDVTLHTLRHTCLTRLARGGLDLMRLQQWAGHSDPKITAERYVHLMPGNLTGGVDILSAIRSCDPANHVIVISTEAGANCGGQAQAQ